MHQRWILAVTLLFGTCVPAAAQNNWPEMARRDLHAIHDVLQQNHPGPVDPLNSNFSKWLNQGMDRALAMADSIDSLDGVLAVLSFYTSGFEDGHLGWGSFFTRAVVSWPGFVVSLRSSDRFVAAEVAPWLADGPEAGDEILSCDGVTMLDRLEKVIMPFDNGIRGLQSSEARLAPLLLVGNGNPWRGKPGSCVIKHVGAEKTILLQWRNIAAADLEPVTTRATYGMAPADFEIQTPAPGVSWITIPSFADNIPDNKAGLAKIIGRLPALRDSRLIVFDVRGNHGGNSGKGYEIAAGLFGKPYVDSLVQSLFAGQYVQWRASEGNATFLENNTMPRFDTASTSYRALRQTVGSMRSAAVAGNALTPAPTLPAASSSYRMRPHELGPKTVLLTDGWCASACLDFADLVLHVPGARHAGATTFADAVYIDNRSILLPSKLGLLGFSMKVYRQRPRANNEPYVPTLLYEGEWRTDLVQKWLLGQLLGNSN